MQFVICNIIFSEKQLWVFFTPIDSHSVRKNIDIITVIIDTVAKE